MQTGNSKRVIMIVMDSLGTGALPDAYKYGDEGADTFGHIDLYFENQLARPLDIPNLTQLGFGNILSDERKPIARGRYATDNPKGSFGKAAELSKGKDTITGHWELAGIYTKHPFKTYPGGFPAELIEKFEKATGKKVLGNCAASGTEIINVLGDEHEKTGNPIVYTSSDSVFQIAANTSVIPPEQLYKMCECARKLLTGEFACGRVIARPYVKDPSGKRIRTPDRKDYAVDPPEDTLLDNLLAAGKKVCAIGKISDIFNGKSISYSSPHTKDNEDGMMRTFSAMKGAVPSADGDIAVCDAQMIFTNLVDFDSKYGHRRDPKGYGLAIEEFDALLGTLISKMRREDLLILCADHGNDPLHEGFDHTREYIPFVFYGDAIKQGYSLGTRSTFADISATVAEYLGVKYTGLGTSFLTEILRTGADE